MMPRNYLKKNKYYPALAIILLIALQSFASKPKLKPQQTIHPVITIDTIRKDFDSDSITADEYYLYMTYTIFSQDSLPGNYKEIVGPRDGTPIIMEVQRAYHSLRPETQKIIRQWIKPLPPKPTRRKP
jgi:hypothetical protein